MPSLHCDMVSSNIGGNGSSHQSKRPSAGSEEVQPSPSHNLIRHNATATLVISIPLFSIPGEFRNTYAV